MLKKWSSAITEISRNQLVTRGVDQEEILKSYHYEEMVYLLLFGRKPTEVESDLFRAVIVSHCSHGITGQSTLAVRMGVDCGSSALNAILAGFLVGSGPYHQGGLEAAMRELQTLSAQSDLPSYIKERIAVRKRIIGFGHRFHDFDPRARVLMELCDRHNFQGTYVQVARKTDEILNVEKSVRMNIETAGGTILLDLGFPVELASLIILIGRGPMLAVAYLERLREGNQPFQKIEVADVLPEGGQSER